MRVSNAQGYVLVSVPMTTVAKKRVELECIGGSHTLDTRDHIPVSVFVHFCDGRVVQISSLMGEDNAPVRPPRYKPRLKTVSRERIFEVEPGGAVLVQKDEIRDIRRVEMVPLSVSEGGLFWRPPGCWFRCGYHWCKECCSRVKGRRRAGVEFGGLERWSGGIHGFGSTVSSDLRGGCWGVLVA